jgi:transcriptional regulator with XRE-family HTH domain
MTEEDYFEILDRIVKGAEYLDNPLIKKKPEITANPWVEKYQLDSQLKKKIEIDDWKDEKKKREEKSMNPVSRKLVEFRKKHNLTQALLADLMGVSASAVRNWEQNPQYPRTPQLHIIADFLNIALPELLDINTGEKKTKKYDDKKDTPSPEPCNFHISSKVTRTEYYDFKTKCERKGLQIHDVIRNLVKEYAP